MDDDGPDDPHETHELARRAREGADFGPLYTRVAPALFAWASFRVKPSLRSQLDPEDLVQEVAIRAYRGISRFDPARGPFRGWVFGIANHVLADALDRLARSRAWSEQSDDERTRALDQLPDDATSASRRLARDESFRRFLDRASALDEQDRGLLVYRGLMGMSHQDVAARVGLSVAAAEKRWQRLAERLRGLGAPEGLLAEE